MAGRLLENSISPLDNTDRKSLLKVLSKNIGNVLKHDEKFVT